MLWQMDRTSILGDTIDYMKELLDKIHKLREDNMGDNEDDDKNHIKSLTPNTRELKSNEAIVRNPPKVHSLIFFLYCAPIFNSIYSTVRERNLF